MVRLAATQALRRTFPVARSAAHSAFVAPAHTRTLFGWLRSKKANAPDPFSLAASNARAPLLTQDNLFHPLSKSPIPAMRARGERVRALAPCPYSLAQGQRKAVAYECPHSGWPTHAGRAEWEADVEKGKYIPRLRESNEDEHDLRSGREIQEFRLPAGQGFEEIINFSSWDVFFYTRNHDSIETDRSRRHVSRLLTFPISVAGVLHENSPLTRRSMRLTHEGLRSMIALRQTLHPRLGDKPSLDVVRLFIVGARAEATLPPAVWDQLRFIFPGVPFHLYLIGPEAVLPTDTTTPPAPGSGGVRSRRSNFGAPSTTTVISEQLTITVIQAPYEEVHAQLEPFDAYTDVFFAFSPGFGFPSQLAAQEAARVREEEAQDEKRMKAARETYHARGTSEGAAADVEAEAEIAAAAALEKAREVLEAQRTGAKAPNPLAPDYTPAEGTPAPEGGEIPSGEPAPAIVASPSLTAVTTAPVLQAQAEWAQAIGQILSTKCALVVTGFSPADVERDVLALESLDGVTGEFEWLITPGENTFASQQWAIADFDPRVAVKANWGIWAIRGKSYNVSVQKRWLGPAVEAG